METNDSKTPVDKFIAEVRSLKPRFGCSDINCPFRNNTLGTNGGCRCLRDLRAVLTQRRPPRRDGGGGAGGAR
jgi:hypothetical protein